MIDYTESLVRILNRIGKDRFLCDPNTTLESLYDSGCNAVDFELAITSFELTHGLLFAPALWEVDFNESLSLTIKEHVSKYLSKNGADDELYATERLLDLRQSIEESLQG